jgi:hypothetical protein
MEEMSCGESETKDEEGVYVPVVAMPWAL